ncbi:hypothetical protein Anapl_06191 [Anas platyrhynchos]|uniref:Uncharacterized protein n=1 Tax=Anas platyrhynchos TaxID=8839 RepID=R0LEX4_ANAPL|nr:hypothetical protein Anapl_06191 [Anas platyrhynchos]
MASAKPDHNSAECVGANVLGTTVLRHRSKAPGKHNSFIFQMSVASQLLGTFPPNAGLLDRHNQADFGCQPCSQVTCANFSWDVELQAVPSRYHVDSSNHLTKIRQCLCKWGLDEAPNLQSDDTLMLVSMSCEGPLEISVYSFQAFSFLFNSEVLCLNHCPDTGDGECSIASHTNQHQQYAEDWTQ